MRKLKEILQDVNETSKLDEVSSKTLGSYVKKATDDVSYNSFMAGDKATRTSLGKEDKNGEDSLSHDKKAIKRQRGIEKATDKLVKKTVKESEETQLNEERATSVFNFVSSLKSLPIVDKLVNVHGTVSGATALIRTKDGNAYEIEIKQAGMGDYHDEYTKRNQYKERKDKRNSKARENWLKFQQDFNTRQ